MLFIDIELSEQDIQNIREIASYYKEDPNEVIGVTMADVIGDAKLILEDDEDEGEEG